MPVGAVPFPFGNCRICKDRATGAHYGVATCEGCKGFFKRSISKGDKYKCFFGGECDVTPKNRNRCKSCRFRRCLESGMAIEAVKMGRIPKMEKEKALEAARVGHLPMEAQAYPSNSTGFEVANYPTDEHGSMSGQQYAMDADTPERSTTVNGGEENDQGVSNRTVPGSLSGGIPVTSEMEAEQIASSSYPSRWHERLEEGTSSILHPSRNLTNLDDKIASAPYSNRSHICTSSDNEVTSSVLHPSKCHTNFDDKKAAAPYSNRTHTCTSSDSGIPSGLYPNRTDNVGGETHSASFVKRNNENSTATMTSDSSYPSRSDTKAVPYQRNDEYPSSYHSRGDSSFRTPLFYLGNDGVAPNAGTDTPYHSFVSWKHNNSAPSASISSEAEQKDNFSARSTGRYMERNEENPVFEMKKGNFGQREAVLGNSRKGNSQKEWDALSPNFPNKNSSYLDLNTGVALDLQNSPRLFHSHNIRGNQGYTSEFQSQNQLESSQGPSFQNYSQGSHNYTSACGGFGSQDGYHSRVDYFELHHPVKTEPGMGSNIRAPPGGHLTKQFKDPSACRDYNSIGDSIKFSSESHSVTTESVPRPSSTPSSLFSEGSSQTSSIKSCFSPGVIKVLIEQVLEVSGEKSESLSQKLAEKLMKVSARRSKKKHLSSSDLDSLKTTSGAATNETPLERSDSASSLTEAKSILEQYVQSPNPEENLRHTPGIPGEKIYEINRFLQDVDRHMKGMARRDESPFDHLPKDSWPTGNNSVSSSRHLSADSWPTCTPTAGTSRELMYRLDTDGEVGFSDRTDGFHSKRIVPSTNDFRNEKAKRISIGSINIENGDGLVEKSELIVNSSESGVSSSKKINEDDKNSKAATIHRILECMKVAEKKLLTFKYMYWEKLEMHRLGKIQLTFPEDKEENVQVVYKAVIESIPSVNERILGFCDHIPGLQELPVEDKAQLIERAYYDLWMISVSDLFRDGDMTFVLPGNIVYQRCMMVRILNKEIVDTFFSFAESLNDLKLSDLELAILGAVQVTNGESLVLKDKQASQKLHSLYLDVLADEVGRNHGDSSSRILIDVFRLMPLLSEINRLQQQIIAKYSLEKAEMVDSKTDS